MSDQEAVRLGWSDSAAVVRFSATLPSLPCLQKYSEISALLFLSTNPIKSALYSVGTAATERDGKCGKFDKIATRLEFNYATAARLMERLSRKMFSRIDEELARTGEMEYN